MEAGVGGVSRRRRTNTDQTAVDSSNLRDFLRVREEDDNGLNSLAGLTLGAVLSCDKRPSPVHMSRTLLDIIRDEEQRGSYKDQNSKKTWKSFKDRLRLRRAGAGWTSSVPIPASDVPIPSCRAEVSQPLPTGMDLTLNNVIILSCIPRRVLFPCKQVSTGTARFGYRMTPYI